MKRDLSLKKQVLENALKQLKVENQHKDKRLNDPKSKYFNNKAQFALDRLAFYMCDKWERLRQKLIF